MNTSSACRGFRSLVFLLAAFACATSAGAAVSLIEPLADATPVRSKFDIKSRAMPVTMSRAALASLQKNDELEIVLPDATRNLVVFDRIEDHGGGIRSSIGYVKGLGKDYRVVITTGPGGPFGSIRTRDKNYRIVPGLDGQDLLVDVKEEQKHIPFVDRGDDSRRAPPGVSELATQGDLRASPEMNGKVLGESVVPMVTPTPQNTIDLLVVYTNGLANRLGSGLITRLYNLVAAANTAYADSEVAITLRLVHATMVNYTDANGDDVALDDVSPVNGGGVGVFSGIETIRNNVGADMVALVRNGSDFGGHGIAWLTTSATPNAPYMYSVSTGCVVGCDSVFIHELGHNMGNAHDRATAAAQQGGLANPAGGAFPYSFGHYVCASGVLTCNPFVLGGCGTLPQCSTSNDNNIGTIMSYFDPVTLKFSNPAISCQQPETSGATSPCGVAGQADNALSMNNMRLALQNVKPTQVSVPTGALQFAASSVSTTDAAATVVLSVNRIGGSGGSVSVNYATQDGTAKSGFDYVAASGTLTWANGDTAAKTITITLVNDGVTEGAESFSINLTNPTGATGVFLGLPTTATIQIGEGGSWPPGGLAFPPGFSAPGSASGVWALESTSHCAVGQSPCAGSPQVIAPFFGTYVFSDLNFSGNFAAGTVAFDHRVSSLSTGFANLQFLIDGVVAFSSEGGETGWVAAQAPITAGTHNVTWRFRNQVHFPCANASSPTPPPNCQDRAWIDNVSLPLATSLSPATTTLGSSANPSLVGQSITLTATVTGASGTPAGVVTFRDGAVVIPGCNLVVMAAGVAQCTTSGLAQGTRSITAAYSGNTTYDVSTSSVLMQVVNAGSFLLTVAKAGTGSGQVTSNPAGINTAIPDNTETYNSGTLVTLTATPQAGSNFTGWSGVGGCPGTGTCQVTMNAITTVTATFTLQQFNLTITPAGTGGGTVTSAPAGINCGVTCVAPFNFGTMVTLTGTPNGGSTFAGWSGGGCSGSAPCTINIASANTVTATFNIILTVPGAPTIISATPGNLQATIAFTAPASDGGSAITGYIASCVNGGTVSDGALTSPITVSPLTNGLTYSCSVVATNAVGASPPSASLNVTPAALILTSVVSRKNHPPFGDCDVPIAIGVPIGGLVSVEPRSSNSHTLRFTFNNTVTSVGGVTVKDASLVDVGSVTLAAPAGNLVTATLNGIPDNKRVTVTLTGLNPGGLSASAAMGFLVGDITGSRGVNAADIGAVKANSGQPLNIGNCRADLNVTGTIGPPDISAVKSRSGKVIP